ncbi:hypothetical protein P691DRAFT_679634 [Macrolepiota fuliginosa MF-IS2]|uniref:G domain-containing protein n=1 Tax=Macrolepiota fuliginosa MF-IS2 TaxID=1400762 RepID=A0A9P5X3I8_9AGAR|nr:hypothetical protein P691DRAFT_679634 [Macrolepiota fuliginosa MF-IS2]
MVGIRDVVEDLQKDDIAIAVMGATGSGKSTFIDLLTSHPSDKNVNAKLKSTDHMKIELTRVRHSRWGDKIVLVDTPGFDNTAKSDLEILVMISEWLQKTYKGGIKLAGLIYLYRITDQRMIGSSLNNLNMFGRLCGDIAMKQVTLVSTMWENIKPEIGVGREAELKEKYWRPFIDKGSGIARLETKNSVEAWKIVENVITEKEVVEAVLLQEELGNLHCELNETYAGRALYRDLQNLLADKREQLKILRDQMKWSTDPALTKEFEKEYKKIRQQFQKTFEEVRKLKIPLGTRVIAFFFRKRARAVSSYLLSYPA